MNVVFTLCCCEDDVHEIFEFATIITTPAGNLQFHYQKERFSTLNFDLDRFADRLLEWGCL